MPTHHLIFGYSNKCRLFLFLVPSFFSPTPQIFPMTH
nr:MAG TPA: hypothetical protein [Caudoviricetes sp.]